jgi:hypothetical protein
MITATLYKLKTKRNTRYFSLKTSSYFKSLNLKSASINRVSQLSLPRGVLEKT